ncbi:MAG: hypothetical protein QG561_345, partial [Patescibacteria group bacterium]|jgi:hypothetical protein
MQS